MQGKILLQKDVKYFHIYQKTADGFLLFYSVKDFLVFFMIFSLAAKKHGIQVVGLCLMPDHVHVLIKAVPDSTLKAFISDYTRTFAKINNAWYGRSGPVFNHSFGHAQKSGDKAIRTAIAYLYNNPVEKWICPKAEKYQWNFVAYYHNPHPFSENIVFRNARVALRKAIRIVKYQYQERRHISYEQLDGLIKGLTSQEIKYLIDYIVKTYNCMDYAELLSHYDSYTKMLEAFATVTVKEYDLNEEYTPGSDRAYTKIISHLNRVFPGKSIRDILSLPPKERLCLYRSIVRLHLATARQSAKFFRI